jgi:D-inositol-3-phosphate glycosyltransferase
MKLHLERDNAAINETASTNCEVSLLTGGFDRPYAFGLAMALASRQVRLDVIGGAEVDSPEMHVTPGLRFLDFYGDPRQASGPVEKLMRVLKFYIRILHYTAVATPKIFHILWNNKFQLFDRTLLMLYYKSLGKRVVFTAHNVNAAERDGNDSAISRFTLRVQYRLADHIFVHTDKMKQELTTGYGVRGGAVTVIPFGINNSVPNTELSPADAKRKLGLREGEKAILFFGAVRPYKGLEYLIAAFQQLTAAHPDYRLIIAGEPKRGSEEYLDKILASIGDDVASGRILARLQFVPDAETEIYFKAADVMILPYTMVFQSGVLFLGYSFGLPAIATDVGSFAHDIIEGRTGFICRPCDPSDLATTIERFFSSDLFRELEQRRVEIREHAEAGHSWEEVGLVTRNVYEKLLRS